MTPAVLCPTRPAPRGHSATRGGASDGLDRGRGLAAVGHHRLAAGLAIRAAGRKGREGEAWDRQDNMTQAGGTDPGP